MAEVESDPERMHEEALAIERTGQRMAKYVLLMTRLHPKYNSWRMPAKTPRFLLLSFYSISHELPEVVFDAANGALGEHNLSVRSAGGPHADFNYHMLASRTEGSRI